MHQSVYPGLADNTSEFAYNVIVISEHYPEPARIKGFSQDTLGTAALTSTSLWVNSWASPFSILKLWDELFDARRP